MPTPKQSPRPKRWLPLPELMGNMPLGKATLMSVLGGPPNPKKWENPPWFKLLKPSHAEAFLRESDIVVEDRLCFFSKHSYNFNPGGNCDLSRIFKKLATSASLLGTDIHEMEASWTGPEELKQANYTLQSLLKGLKFLRVVPTSESPKVMGLVGIHDPNALWHFAGFTYCPWCGKEGQNEGTVVNHLRTMHYRLGLCVISVMAVQPPHAIPSTAMATTIVAESSLLQSQSHLTNPSSKLRTPTKKSR